MNYTDQFATDRDLLNLSAAAAGKSDQEDGSPLGNGEATFSRRLCSSSLTIATQSCRLAFFRARTTAFSSGATFLTAGTAAATVTTIQYGLFEADDAETTFTLVASTTNDTELLAAINTSYYKAFTTGVARTRGKLYGLGCLFVGTTAPVVVASPVLLGPVDSTSIAYNPSPISGVLTSITSLPATFTKTTLVAGSGNQAPYALLS